MLLEMRNIEKRFPGVHALKNVDLTLAAGEVLALVGENGAGKSTLIRALGGAGAPDEGAILIDGRDIRIHNPVAARQAGVAIIYQEFNLVPALSARENIFLGREQGGLLRANEERRQAAELFRRIGANIDPDTPIRSLSVAQQQMVEIAKALSVNARILVMDEPSAVLTNREVENLFRIVGELKAQGLGIIYISHRLEEIFQIADRVMVMRDGAAVASHAVGEMTRPRLIELMVGRKLEQEFPRRSSVIGPVRLRVSQLCRGAAVREVSFSLHAGEVLGLTGLVGAGRTEVARLIFGADQADSGTIELDGAELHLRSPREAIARDICLLTEDRKNQGLVLGHSVRENFGLPNLPVWQRLGFIHGPTEKQEFARSIGSLRIKVPHQETPARNLSGGNQQKVVLAKWLARDSSVIIFDEPTRGIDVGAKFEIYTLINELAARGKAILMISSELPEVLGMSDRILVMHDGRITGEIAHVAAATQEEIMRLAVA